MNEMVHYCLVHGEWREIVKYSPLGVVVKIPGKYRGVWTVPISWVDKFSIRVRR